MVDDEPGLSGAAAIVPAVRWAKRVSDGATVWPESFMDADEARTACREREVLCPDCGDEITFTSACMTRRGPRRGCFRHYAGGAADDNCPGAARMSAQHLAAQSHIARALQRRHPGAIVRLEEIHAATARRGAGRSDIVLEPPEGPPLCIEVQVLTSKLAVADLQDRTASRVAAGYVVEWIFIVARQDWAKPLKIPAILDAVLDARGYLYVIEDPMEEHGPALRIAVHPEISSQIPDLRERQPPSGHVFFLWAPRKVVDFVFVGSKPGAAGLRCQRLHSPVARWIEDRQRALNRIQPRDVPRQDPSIKQWQIEHDHLEHRLALADHARQAAWAALHEANSDATAATAITPAAAKRVAEPVVPERWRDRLRLWRRRRPAEQPPVAVHASPRPHPVAERRATAARARVAARRDELTQRDAEHQAAAEAVTTHAARRAEAKQRDDDRHSEAERLARARLDAWRSPQLELGDRWLQALPTTTSH